jgi:hypothetical protein
MWELILVYLHRIYLSAFYETTIDLVIPAALNNATTNKKRI